MGPEQITFYSYASGSALLAALIPVTLYLRRAGVIGHSLLVAALASTVWQIAIALNYYQFPLDISELLIIEICRYGAWIYALLATLKYTTGQDLPGQFRLFFHGTWICALLGAVALKLTDHQLADNSSLLIWTCLILSIVVFIAVEQLYKNSNELRLIKLWSTVAGAIFGYDIYLFAHSLVFNQINPQLWQARGAINGTAALILALGSLALFRQSTQKTKLTLSRPVAFYTTSMTIAGSFLALMAVGGYYVQLHGGTWGTIVHVLVMFLALLTISLALVSRTIRSRVNVWIDKHFFRHKYDYREEWLKLINYLSRSPDVQDFQVHAITAVASVFKSAGGSLWMLEGNQFTLRATLNVKLPDSDLREDATSEFSDAMRNREWVFSPNSNSSDDLEYNRVLPEWIHQIPDIWLVLPLLIEQELLGFMILTKPNPNHDTPLTWEDLDLLKNVGRQVASYLDRHNAVEIIAESRQFDAFNKLTAFIMHDLKNLIAQQALVVENAAKHKENPAFVEDAISTIENSVARMSTLLKKLQHSEPAELRALELHKILIESAKKCQSHRPVPSLRLEDTDLIVNADPDHMTMSIVHLIKNAQEATPGDGFVDVTLRREDNNAIITIEDNGEGMDEEFIRNHLFKPFVTTKSGKGMGIGVYQAREFIIALEGQLSVDSEPGVGTTFTICLPANRI